MGIISEFRQFLEEYKVTALALAFIIGKAVNDLVWSLSNNVIMPFTEVLIPSGTWENASLSLGPVDIMWGPFLSALIYFVIIAFIVFLIAKFLLNEKEVKKR